MVRLQEEVVRDVRATLYLLWAGTSRLLVGAVNLVNLFLMRSAGRWRELATRHAIGASVARVDRQVLTETTLLAVCGGAMGGRRVVAAEFAHEPGSEVRRDAMKSGLIGRRPAR